MKAATEAAVWLEKLIPNSHIKKLGMAGHAHSPSAGGWGEVTGCLGLSS